VRNTDITMQKEIVGILHREGQITHNAVHRTLPPHWSRTMSDKETPKDPCKEQPEQLEGNGRRGAILGGLAALAGSLTATGAGARSQVVAATQLEPAPSPIVDAIGNPFATTEFASPTILVARAIDFVDRAARHGERRTADWNYVSERWEEGRQLFDTMRASVAADGLSLTRTVVINGQQYKVEVDYNTPLPTIDQLVKDEYDIFYRTGNAYLAVATTFVADDWGKVAISKLLAIFGLTEFSKAFFEVLSEYGWLDPRLWGRKELPRTLERLLNWLLRDPKFLAALTKKIGAGAAAKVIGKIAGRLVPFLGWALIIGSLLWAIYDQWIKPAPAPGTPPTPPTPPTGPTPIPTPIPYPII